VELSLTIPQEGVAHIRCVLETSRKSCPWWSFWEGRVESNTVRIEAKAAEAVPAGPKALPPMPAPEPAPGPAAGGPQPRWQPGGNTVEAVDAASGKLLWKANVGFPIGNVVAGPAQWAITSQDGRQAVTIDAATGKMLLRDDLAPPKPADPQETF